MPFGNDERYELVPPVTYIPISETGRDREFRDAAEALERDAKRALGIPEDFDLDRLFAIPEELLGFGGCD